MSLASIAVWVTGGVSGVLHAACDKINTPSGSVTVSGVFSVECVTYGDRIPSYSAFGIMPHNYDMQLRQCSYFVRRQSILASTCRINYY